MTQTQASSMGALETCPMILFSAIGCVSNAPHRMITVIHALSKTRNHWYAAQVWTSGVGALETHPIILDIFLTHLMAFTVMRPSVIASAPWAEIDLQAAEWHVPAARMKSNSAHIVSLPKQAIALLTELQQLTGHQKYVFPSPAKQKTPHINRDSLSAALRKMGFQGVHATHGFRGMFRTVGRERLGIDSDILEAQLAHAKKGDVAKAYDRTTFNDARRDAMQQWADYLDVLKLGAKVIPIKLAS
jgi:integrase